jgi:iron complex outermembrane recepter protein
LGRLTDGSTEKVPLNLIEVILAQGSLFRCAASCGKLRFQPTCHRYVEHTMAILRPSRTRHALRACGFALWCAASQAQTATAQLDPVSVTGRAPVPIGVSGWGEIPLARLPLQATVFGTEQIKGSGAQRLSDLTGFDAALGDAYNAEGYWDFLAVRGFVIDNRFNYRRDGLPINAETSIGLSNKARIEVLKGASGIQAGTSAPGGMVNFVVARPLDAPLSSARIEWRERASVTGAVDLSRRFGDADAFGLRLNAEAAKLRPQTRSADGERHLFALAGEWRLSHATRIELEGETSRRSQPSVPGFSMLGNSVPDARAVDPRINLNNQAWTQPVVLQGDTASLRITHRFDADWSLVAHGATQRLRSDDRIAFPSGCFDPNPPPDGTYYADRYCPDGSFDLYEFRSDNERRRTDALDVSVAGRFLTGPVRHQARAGIAHSSFRARFEPQVFAPAGTGNISGTAQVPASPGNLDPSTNRDERSTELHMRDALSVDDRSMLWLGLRHTSLHRRSVGTDASRPIDYAQTVNAPFVAASHLFAPNRLLYASWGKGVESEAVPNLPIYANGGQALPVLKSRQIEAGLKAGGEGFDWSVIGFDIVRPAFSDVGSCDLDDTCLRILDGDVRHRGVELSGLARAGAWTLQGGSQWLHARRQGSRQASLNGRQPTNVPALTLKAQVGHDVAALPGLNLTAGVVRESRRMVLPDNSAAVPGHTRIDAALRYATRAAGATWTWRAGVDNVLDERAWKESPYQFGHAYLFPLAPRTWRVSLQADL